MVNGDTVMSQRVSMMAFEEILVANAGISQQVRSFMTGIEGHETEG